MVGKNLGSSFYIHEPTYSALLTDKPRKLTVSLLIYAYKYPGFKKNKFLTDEIINQNL